MKKRFHYLWVLVFLFTAVNALSTDVPISEASRECLECHTVFQPGIVEDWKESRHATVTPKQAAGVKKPARKVSADTIPERLQTVVVGCAECHTLRSGEHSDHVEHNGHEIHIVVSPADCATCHATEADQYSRNIMSHAYKNLAGNPVYQDLQRTIIGKPVLKQGSVHFDSPDETTKAEACFYCHGTRLTVTGFETRDTEMGEVTLPQISGWPNQGVGRLNLDGSRGACTACHTRHTFSIEMARKPYTCKECHVGPDVPAFKVYMSSKHGNIFASMNKNWNFKKVPWTIGRDFAAPTCAACHISLLANTEGEVVVNRTHQMNDRLSWRIFGLTYAHPQPIDPDTTIIKNKDGLTLATDFLGGFAKGFLLDPDKQKSRKETMQTACLACHDPSWVKGHFTRYENAIGETNAATLTATEIMMKIWKSGHAIGIDRGGSPFDEAVEKKWTDIWLFYANTIRFSAAMAGGGDYGVFADGRYHLSKGIQELSDWLKLRESIFPIKEMPSTEKPAK